ncbi:hypothetical protein DFJ73DRAFT_131702 [Zopfochytrium polystomum]|nr:hypothetical protein DFJ73DRAFT_131702 [Zopfochytrium polystomum]
MNVDEGRHQSKTKMNYLVPWHTSAEWDDLVDLAQQYLKDGQHYFKCADPTELVNALFDTSGRESDPYYRASFSPSYEEYALTLIRTLKESPSSWIPIAVRTTKDTIGLAIFGELVLFVTRFLGKGNNPPWDESTAVVLLQRAKFISLLYTLQDCFPRGRLIALHTCQKTIINLHNSILCELADKSISHKLSDLEKKLVNLAGTAHYFLNDVFRCYREEKFSYDQRAVVASPSGSYAYIVKRLGMNLRSLKSAPMASLVGKQLEVQMAEIVGGGLPRPDQAP